LRDFYKITTRFILALSFVVGLSVCRGPDNNKLADVNGTVITTQEIERAAGRPLFQLNQQIYALQRQKLDELIDERLLAEEAKRRGVSVEALFEQEVNAKLLPVTDDDILALYKANKERIPVELEKVKDKIRDLLKNQRLTSQKALFIKSLRDKAKIVSYLKPPVVYRVRIDTTNAPSRGQANARVSIIKFEDFECPFCKSVQPTLAELLKKYDGKLRIVHMDLPLHQIHPQAELAAEAARCAGDQDNYWQYHDTLYQNAPKLSHSELKAYAKEVGIDTAPFEQCLSSGKYKSLVQKDLSEGAQLGITGTPTFFINGREAAGALPLESFAAIIDEELARAK
jgi:protein-disulfide isomerase